MNEINEILDTMQAHCDGATIPFAPLYKVCADGSVWSHTNWRGYGARKLKASPNGHGYLRVGLVLPNGHTRKAFVHKLVAAAFLPAKPTAKHELRHLNGDRHDNRASNLAWGTSKENAADREAHGRTAKGQRNGAAKLCPAKVASIRALAKTGASSRELGRRFGVHSTTILDVLHGESWADINALATKGSQ